MREFLQTINDYPWTCFFLALFSIVMAALIFQRNMTSDTDNKQDKGDGYEGH